MEYTILGRLVIQLAMKAMVTHATSSLFVSLILGERKVGREGVNLLRVFLA